MSEPLKTISLLVVEDDEDDFLITKHFLENLEERKYLIDWAPTAQSGIDQLKRKQYDVCLVDYRLGRETGADFISMARRVASATPMIALTGSRDEQTDQASMDAGAAGFLVKGQVDKRDLDRAIRYAIRNHSQANQTGSTFEGDGAVVDSDLLADRLAHAIGRTIIDGKLVAVILARPPRSTPGLEGTGPSIEDALGVKLRSLVEAHQTVGRLGDGEFVAVIEGVESVQGAEEQLATLQSRLSPIEVSADGFDLRANIECGLAVASSPTADWRELVDEARAEAELIVTRSHSLAE